MGVSQWQFSFPSKSEVSGQTKGVVINRTFFLNSRSLCQVFIFNCSAVYLSLAGFSRHFGWYNIMVLLLLVAQDKGDETEGTLERPLKCPLDMSISYTEKENFISESYKTS